jgi:hypothetical protein
LSASPAGARSIMAAPGTSMSNGFPAPGPNRCIAVSRDPSPKDPPHVRPHHAAHPAIRRHERLL